jgi:hypothetical protein
MPALDVRLLPYASFAWTVIVEVVVPFASIETGEAVIADCARLAMPAVPVDVNVTGDPVSVPLVAVIVFEPAIVPRVQLPTVAMPLAFVVADAPVTAPPPVATANVTLTPLTTLLLTSFTITLGAVATAEPAVDDCPLPAFTEICVAAPAVPVAVNITGDPVSEPLVAVIVFDPAIAPNVQLPTVAMPLAFVVAVNPVPDPPPLATTNVTDTPETTLLFTSFTITLGAVATAEPAVADCPSPALTAICVAGPAVSVTLAVDVNAAPLSVPEIVALPAIVGDVRVAVYVPL